MILSKDMESILFMNVDSLRGYLARVAIWAESLRVVTD